GEHKAERSVSIPVGEYAACDHGYATTIHKSQGATVDRTSVLASNTMYRHLTYVAHTRHREAVSVYAGRDVFADMGDLKQGLSRSNLKETTLDYARKSREEPVDSERSQRSLDRVVQAMAPGEDKGYAVSRGHWPFLARRGIEVVETITDTLTQTLSESLAAVTRRAEQLIGHPSGQQYEQFKLDREKQRTEQTERIKSQARGTYQQTREARAERVAKEAQREQRQQRLARSLQRERSRGRGR
ncbi:MAG: hypothetical protein WBD51_07050, partial [Burkholderiaceae bacterium]